MSNLYRAIPSVSKILDDIYAQLSDSSIIHTYPQGLVTEIINNQLNIVREKIKNSTITSVEDVINTLDVSFLIDIIEKKFRPKLHDVINGTGVVIHTNLGRSPLSQSSLDAISINATSYSTLEFDTSTGERGSRHSIVRDLLTQITKAEDALVVNNNAAAVMLVLSSLAQGGETVISRGELVEVGGSFRIPDVMECSGSTLKDVGTTNKTHAKDYIEAINENTKAFMRVHTSNFRLIGFTSNVSTAELSEIAHDNNIPMIEDLGSGSFIDFSFYGLPKEPTVQEVVSQGVDIVTFSGDKLLGGPQAGIIVGKKKYIEQIKKNQLLRALRPCKLTFAALESTLKEYLNMEQALKNIPTLNMLTQSSDEIENKAKKLSRVLKLRLSKDKVNIFLTADSSRVGGGAFPEAPLPTTLVNIEPKIITPQRLKNELLKTSPPIIGRLSETAFSLDSRTLKTEQFKLIADVLEKIL